MDICSATDRKQRPKKQNHAALKLGKWDAALAFLRAASRNLTVAELTETRTNSKFLLNVFYTGTDCVSCIQRRLG